MDAREYDIIIEKIKKILQNKPLDKDDIISHSLEVDRVQEALIYISNSLVEMNEFSTILCRGELDAPQPSRHNYFAGGLKELHAVLKHLTWQTKQVASGDYKQRIEFLGDFSVAFNQMIEQLEERERMLKEQMKVIEQTANLLTTVMDEHKDWILVESTENKKIVYNNRLEEYPITNFSLEKLCMEEVPIETRDGSIAPLDSVIYRSTYNNHYYAINEYPMTWDGHDVLIHYIADITNEREVQKDLSEKAYVDQLTGIYNRRYCMMKMEQLMEDSEPFSLVMVDLNNLKTVNDEYGHEEGDSYINHCVSEMSKYTRETDVLCRMGGDEFILLLINCDEEVSHKKMKDIFQSIQGIHQKGYAMSISYGIACMNYDGQISTIDKLIGESDAKMYEFKVNYKNTMRG